MSLNRYSILQATLWLGLLTLNSHVSYSASKIFASPLILFTIEKEDVQVSTSNQLIENQRKLIFSGFPAYSLLDISYLLGNKEQIVETRTCSARYDLWEEKIHILTIDGKKQVPPILGSFEEYDKTCLSLTLTHEQRQIRQETAPEWVARLSLTQLTGEASQKIRDWLVGQQSGIIKGLFSHMLGDLTLSETSSFEFRTQANSGQQNPYEGP